MNGIQFLKMIGDTRAFRQSAWLIEREICRLSVRPGDLSPVGGEAGWPSHNVWESLKTASHFNLATALELRLKCLLRLHDILPLQGRDGHRLARLHEQFGEQGHATEMKLEKMFHTAIMDHPFRMEAFLNTGTTDDTPAGPSARELKTLRGVLTYMDEDAELWRKRYSWESASDRQWQHYIDEMEAFFSFLDETEKLAMEMAQQHGIIIA